MSGPARRACVVAIGAVVLAGCADRLVELPTHREPAVPVRQAAEATRCPADTVAYGDDDLRSGAGAVPADFEARTVVRCEIDFTTSRTRNGVERLSVRQWRASMTPELATALNLPDRELRPARACASASGGATAVYLVDARHRWVRVVLPHDDPCQQIRAEVLALLPPVDPLAGIAFHVTRRAR